MKIVTTFTVGSATYTLEVEDSKEMEALHKAIVLSNPRRKCNVCENFKRLRLDSNKDKDGNIYVNMVCLNKECLAKSKLGLYKSGGYFWKEFERYEPNKNKD